MKVTAQKIGGIWHGFVEGHREIDERGLTEEVAKRKAVSVGKRLGISVDDDPESGSGEAG